MSSRNDRGGGGGRGGRGGGRGGGGGGGGRGGGHSGGGGSRSTDSAVMTTGTLISNAYRVNFDSKIVWYRTGLDFDTDSRRTRLAIFNAIKDQLSKDFDSLVFDGTVVYSRAALTDNKKMQTNVFGREHSVSTISSKPIGASPEDALSLWNILLRKVLESRGMARIYDNHFDLSRPMPLDERDANAKIEIYRGVLSEISQRFIGQKPGLYLSLDPAHKVVSTESILSLCERVKEKEAFIRAVRGKRVLTRHNYKAYGVEGVEYSMTPKSTFTMTNRKTGAEEKVTFEKYYKDQGVVIKNMSQPLLISTGRKRERIYLVPELCVFASVPASAKARLPQITSLKPAARAIRIAELLKHVTEVSTRKGALALKQFGLEIEPAVVPIASTRLATPTIVFAPKTQKTPTSGEWRNEAANVKFTHISSQKLAVYPVVLYDINMNLEQGFSITQYWADIKSSMNAMAAPLALQKDLLFPYKGSANTSMEAMLKIAQTKLPKDASANQVLVVAFISDDGRKDASKQYDEYRQYCLAHGFIGQAINVSSSHQKRKLDDRNRSSIVGNLARQIVNKFSHAAWWFNVPTILPKHSNKTFIFIGMDVFHAAPELIRVAKDEKDPSKKSEHAYWQKRSIVGYSAKFSTGVGVPLFYCDTETRDAGAEVEGQRTQSSKPSEAASEAGSAHLRQTTSQQASSSSSSSAPGAAVPTGGLGKFLHDCLNHWKAYIKDPASLVVIVYRDGVADSQLDQVDESEVAQLKSVLPANAHAIYSVVQKRVHNRFMMSDAGKYGNCSGGTVVEDLARVSGGRYNFFLVPCATTLSTNKPVHYTITYDSKPGTISNTEFHALAFASHHTYQNWAGTVKVPDVCQNAHTLAYLLGESGVRDPVIPVNLKPSMFFL